MTAITCLSQGAESSFGPKPIQNPSEQEISLRFRGACMSKSGSTQLVSMQDPL